MSLFLSKNPSEKYSTSPAKCLIVKALPAFFFKYNLINNVIISFKNKQVLLYIYIPNLGFENLSHLIHLVYSFCVQDASDP